jgi:hypothetical protein
LYHVLLCLAVRRTNFVAVVLRQNYLAILIELGCDILACARPLDRRGHLLCSHGLRAGFLTGVFHRVDPMARLGGDQRLLHQLVILVILYLFLRHIDRELVMVWTEVVGASVDDSSSSPFRIGLWVRSLAPIVMI